LENLHCGGEVSTGRVTAGLSEYTASMQRARSGARAAARSANCADSQLLCHGVLTVGLRGVGVVSTGGCTRAVRLHRVGQHRLLSVRACHGPNTRLVLWGSRAVPAERAHGRVTARAHSSEDISLLCAPPPRRPPPSSSAPAGAALATMDAEHTISALLVGAFGDAAAALGVAAPSAPAVPSAPGAPATPGAQARGAGAVLVLMALLVCAGCCCACFWLLVRAVRGPPPAQRSVHVTLHAPPAPGGDGEASSSEESREAQQRFADALSRALAEAEAK
jgi:hypothetical protein